jgi:hypothetical protein
MIQILMSSRVIRLLISFRFYSFMYEDILINREWRKSEIYREFDEQT